jgi:hypothetical protein
MVRDANITSELVETDPSGNAGVGEVKHGRDGTNQLFARPGCRTFGLKETQKRFRPLV